MDSFLNPFSDLPQIQLHEEGYLNGNHWQPEQYVDFESIGRPFPTGRPHMFADFGLELETGNCNLPPMDRFKHGIDSSPFSSGMALAERKLKEIHVNSPYQPTSPDLYHRQFSPAETEGSSIGCETFSACHSDDFQQYSQDHRASLCDSPEVHIPYFTQTQYNYSTRSPELPLGGGSSIALSQIQHAHDIDAIYQQPHAHLELDGDGESDPEQDLIVFRPLGDTYQFRSDEDEGLGESIVDSESVNCSSREGEDDEEEDPEYKPSSAHSPKATRSRRSSGATRYSHGRKASTTSAGGRISKPKAKKAHNPNAARPFPCPLAGYGCLSTFTSKNEWKRHVSTQHIKLGFWRCDMCSPSADPMHPVYNDFNRKDLFTQHLRRMHTHHHLSTAANRSSSSSANSRKNDGGLSDEAVLVHQQRCYRQLRTSPPRSSCLFCPRVFHGEGSWEERMEHVGAHFERERKSNASNKVASPESWKEDPILRDWLLQEGLIEHDDPTGWRIGSGNPVREL